MEILKILPAKQNPIEHFDNFPCLLLFSCVDVIFVIKVFQQTEATLSLMLIPMPIQAKFDILSFLKSELCSSITANKKCIFFEKKKR